MLKVTVSLVLCILVTLSTQIDSGNAEMGDILQYMREGDRLTVIDDDYKDVVVLVGVGGSGKGTLTQFITGDNSKMVANKLPNGQFAIKTNYDQSKPGPASNITFPELVVHKETNTAYYDCPSFGNTKPIAYDIGTSYLIRKVIDTSAGVKVVLVASASAFRPGNDMTEFMTIMQHVTRFINNTSGMCPGIGLVVTKVDNVMENVNGDNILVPDDKVIEGLANVLNDNIVQLKQSDRFNHSQEAIEVIECLLEKINGVYTKIGIFRRPNESGPFSESQMLQHGRSHIIKIVTENLNYVPTNNSLFGQTVSNRSKESIIRILNEHNQVIVNSFDSTASKLISYYSDYSLDTKKLETGEHFIEAFESIVNLINVTHPNTSRQHFLSELLKPIRLMNDTTLNVQKYERLAHLFNYIDFFESASGQQLKSIPFNWIRQFKSLPKMFVDKVRLHLAESRVQDSRLFQAIFSSVYHHFIGMSKTTKLDVDSQWKSDYDRMTALITQASSIGVRPFLNLFLTELARLNLPTQTLDMVEQLQANHDYNYITLRDISGSLFTQDNSDLIGQLEVAKAIIANNIKQKVLVDNQAAIINNMKNSCKEAEEK